MSITIPSAGTFPLNRAVNSERWSVTGQNEETHEVCVDGDEYVVYVPGLGCVRVNLWSHMVIIRDMLNTDFDEETAKARILAHEDLLRSQLTPKQIANGKRRLRAKAEARLSRQDSSPPKPTR